MQYQLVVRSTWDPLRAPSGPSPGHQRELAYAQSLPKLSFNLNTNGKVHLIWTVPTVSSILQEASSLSSTGAWQASSLNVFTNGCISQVLVPPNHPAGFYRLASTNPSTVGIYLGTPTQLLQSNQWGMTDVPDMHTAIVQQSNTYHLWIAGRFENDKAEGATGLLNTTNYVDYWPGYSAGTTNVVPVFVPSSLQVARSAITNDGAPGTWFKYYTNAFNSPALGGLGAQIVPIVCGCTRNAQPWPVFSTYLNAYVLVFLANEGWFFSTSTNLVTWSSPTQFFTAPNIEFTAGLPTDENVILVTPGNPTRVIGQTGIVLYAQTPDWTGASHELWSRPFAFIKTP